MSNVVALNNPKNGENSFISCPCSPTETSLIIVVTHDSGKQFISALVCERCETEIPVCNGILGAKE